MTPPRPNHPGLPPRGRRGFTLVELLIVMVILALLIALLLPAINSAMRTARNGAVGAEISQLSNAIAQFKTQYGVYPPSRIIISESGDYSAATIASALGVSNNVASALGQRSLSYLRRIWPQMAVSASSQTNVLRYDFDGNGSLSPMKVVQGTECLVFFLGGIPQATDSGYSVTGFAKSPTNPMQNNITTANRSQPMFEFRPGRLVDTNGNGFPEYLDGVGGSNPRPFVYFSSYEGQGYDPDDNNYLDPEDVTDYPTTGVLGAFVTSNAPTGVRNTTRTDIVASQAPNPYTTNSPVPVDSSSGGLLLTDMRPRDFINKSSFQIISAGNDNSFGIGGQLDLNGSETLPFPETAIQAATSQSLPNGIRRREWDNITNLKNGALQ